MNELATTDRKLASLILPIQNGALLLPNHCVLEVLMAGLSSAMASPFVLGSVDWRGTDIPVMSFEGLLQDDPREDIPFRQVAVLVGMLAPDRLPYFAVALSGMPHLRQVRDVDIRKYDPGELPPVVHSRLRLDEEELLVPNWDVMEASLLQTLFGDGSWSSALPPAAETGDAGVGRE